MVQLSKTGVRDTLKAGHPPAVKAGGKRVVKKSADENANVEKETRKTDKPRSVLAPSRMQHLSLLLSGPLEKLGHDFPETPVSVRHSRVRPSVEKPHISRIPCIQQPRKF
ncbi:death-associated protein-like 1 homolog [Danio rerio]|uniref:Death-associated protein-like 1 homolog n=2 Tax=Danio rerio TaxID=7955 RepID=DAP1B_DANRE|nr:death-associated protein-like 1 homolog [Danio rerio]XP_017213204.1 death-associated protein-like 1 isoform X1 [Danio rerio]XP_017213348.1 death-associated protein-like 1-B [Danio rerio]Q9I9N0.1 RecName: Full=Death-associated protein-like 1 homolog; AltName: Full=Death-associated protein 1b [Danio rerio]7OYA_s1 Chain s1, Dap1b [Danio rerio]7OYD_s1 Chain s1, Dap1b [Danio rerio]AAF66958.1 Dap1b [Danio rerio]AAI15169.1 Death associated protein 1b [Danio rerio]|eukprot:NP_571648.1 death-associated protein-like 1 [Danio rerio]